MPAGIVSQVGVEAHVRGLRKKMKLKKTPPTRLRQKIDWHRSPPDSRVKRASKVDKHLTPASNVQREPLLRVALETIRGDLNFCARGLPSLKLNGAGKSGDHDREGVRGCWGSRVM